MSRISTTAYHTCLNKNGIEYIQKNVPFRCVDRKGQWLGVGYYFWPDDDHFAHKWGEDSYDNNYVITKFTINYAHEELFDLCGNLAHKFELEKYCDEMKAMLASRVKSHPKDQKAREMYNNGNISISEVFWYLRNKRKDSFSYKLVKIADDKKIGDPIKFVANKFEKINLIERIQMVVYPEAISYAVCDGIHYPKTPHEGDKNEKL